MATRKERNLAERLYTCVWNSIATTKKDNKREKKRYCINSILQMIQWSRVTREPLKTKYIYVVTTLRFGYKYINKTRSGDRKYHSYDKRTAKSQRKYFTIVRQRTWGWFPDLKEAQRAVRNNWADIYEGEYNYAVIERVTDGLLHGGDTIPEWWYKWEGSWEKGRFKKWKKPPEYNNIIGFMDRMKKIRCHWGDINDE